MRYPEPSKFSSQSSLIITSIFCSHYLIPGFLLSSTDAIKDLIIPFDLNQTNVLSRFGMLNWGFPLAVSLASIIFIGFLNKQSRRWILIASDIIIFCSAILSLFMQGFKSYTISRALAGASSALTMLILPKYIKEVFICLDDEDKTVKRQLEYCYLSFGLGVSLGLILPRLTEERLIVDITVLAICGVQIALEIFWLPESPIYLLDLSQEGLLLRNMTKLGLTNTSQVIDLCKNHLMMFRIHKSFCSTFQNVSIKRLAMGLVLVSIKNLIGQIILIFYLSSFFEVYAAFLNDEDQLNESGFDMVEHNMLLMGISTLLAQLGSMIVFYSMKPPKKNFFILSTGICGVTAFLISFLTYGRWYELSKNMIFLYMVIWRFGFGSAFDSQKLSMLTDREVTLIDSLEWGIIACAGALFPFIYKYLFQIGEIFAILGMVNLLGLFFIIVFMREIDRLIFNPSHTWSNKPNIEINTVDERVELSYGI